MVKDDNTKERVPNDELLIKEIYGNRVSSILIQNTKYVHSN